MLVDQKQLAAALNYEPNQTAKIEKCLRDQGIPVFYGKGGCVWTTTESIAQLGIKELSSSESISIDGIDHGKAA